MKRIVRVTILLAMSALLAATAAAQSLGEVARQHREKKQSAQSAPTAERVWTNEDLPAATIRDDGAEAPRPEAGEAKAAAAAGEEDAAPDRTKLEAEWRDKFAEHKKVIAQLEREIDILQREARLRAASFYADAGTRLRDEKKFAEEQRQEQEQVATKQKELDAARQKLEDMRRDLRRAGLPSSIGE